MLVYKFKNFDNLENFRKPSRNLSRIFDIFGIFDRVNILAEQGGVAARGGGDRFPGYF